MKGVVVVKVRQLSPTPCSLVRLRGQAVAIYDTAAFLDARARDLGGRVAESATLGFANEKGDERLATTLAIAVILAILGVIVALSLKLTYP